MKRVIVTGCAGFIGSHLSERLVNMGVYVVGVDNLSAGKMSNMKTFIDSPNFSFHEADITNYGLLKHLFTDVDTVFHQAASKKTVCMKDPMRDLEVNAKGTYNLLLLSEHFGVKKFVHASTGSVYGESNGKIQDENFNINPCSFYGISKFAGERYVNLFHKEKGLNTTILRYFHVIGTRQENNEYGGVMAIFAKKLSLGQPVTIFGDGTQMRCFTHVSDIVEANICSATKSISIGQIYNVCADSHVTLLDATEKLSIALNAKLNINYLPAQEGDIKFFNVSNEKIKAHFGIEFRDFDKSIRNIL